MKNFTLSLYAFHLARNFNDPLDRATEAGAKTFGQELQGKLATQINLKPELTTLLLHDTYFADLTFSAPVSALDFTPDQIKQFQPRELLPDNTSTLMGQTIGIYGEVASKLEDKEVNQNLADDYVRNFLENTPYKNDQITASNHSNLLGFSLFEYFCLAPQSDQSSKTTRHILVLLNHQGKNSLEKLRLYYQDIVNLLCSYHKIKLVYQQAELSYQAALKEAQEIEKEIDNFENYVSNKNRYLDNLSTMLDRLPLLALNHADYCGELELDRITIEINQQNYQDSLQKLLNTGSNLDSWQEFSNQTKNIFLKQIQYWLNYMNPRKELGQQLTASIRGIVEIEQAGIDRELQNTIQSVGTGIGVGVGVGGIVATSYPLITKENPLQFPSAQLPPHPIIIAIGLSLLSGGGLGFLAWNFTRKRLKSVPTRNLELNPADQKSDRPPT